MAALNAQGLISPDDDSYDGATVLRPKCGYYGPIPIATLDFASMYPSIIEEHNLCYKTFVTNKTIRKCGLIPSYYDENGRLVEMDYWRLHEFVVDEKGARFEARHNNPAFLTKKFLVGILPQLEADLKAERKKKKNRIEALDKLIGNLCAEIGITDLVNKKEGLESERKAAVKAKDDNLSAHIKGKIDEIDAKIKAIKKSKAYEPALAWESEKALLDIEQNVIKGIMNSMYGITGDPTSKYYFKPIATTITGCGRNMIAVIKHIAETEFNRANGWWYVYSHKLQYSNTNIN